MDSLFGSGDSTQNIAAQLYPASSEQTGLLNTLNPIYSNLASSGGTSAQQGLGLMNQSSNGQLSDAYAKNLSNYTTNALGTSLNGLANRGILGDGSPLETGMSGVAQGVNNQYLNDLQSQYSMGSGLVSGGLSSLSPANSMWTNLLNQQSALSSPAQTIVNQGSSGLFGSALGGAASSLGSKWASNW